jgi:hypothetical protein
MAKAIQFSLQDQPFAVALGTKISKATLYGYPKRIAEKDGVALSRGVLLPDGQLLARSAIGYPKADDGGTPIDAPVAHIDGTTVEQFPSSFNKINALEPIDIADLALFSVRDVYPIEGETFPPAGLYRGEFNYNAGYQLNEARLLVRGDGLAFLLIGVTKASTPVAMSVNYSFFDTDEQADEDSDEQDFSMV